jgi:hypothetical protein
LPDTYKSYPDNQDIFARKMLGRKVRAGATFAEKLAAMDSLKARVAPLVQARKARRAKGVD